MSFARRRRDRSRSRSGSPRRDRPGIHDVTWRDMMWHDVICPLPLCSRAVGGNWTQALSIVRQMMLRVQYNTIGTFDVSQLYLYSSDRICPSSNEVHPLIHSVRWGFLRKLPANEKSWWTTCCTMVCFSNFSATAVWMKTLHQRNESWWNYWQEKGGSSCGQPFGQLAADGSDGNVSMTLATPNICCASLSKKHLKIRGSSWREEDLDKLATSTSK